MAALHVAVAATSALACGSSNDPGQLKLDDAVGQLLLISIRATAVDAEIDHLLDEVEPGGVILFDYDGPNGGAQPSTSSHRNSCKR